jgi:multiple sugar transport system ATP-binding protein
MFVAAFIGSPSMNLFEGVIDKTDDGARLHLGDQQVALGPAVLDRRHALADHLGRPIVVGIRPEDMEDATYADSATMPQLIKAKVGLIESLGSEVVVHLLLDARRVDSGDPDTAQEIASASANAVARFDPRTRARIGDTIAVAVNVANLHFFDPGTGIAVR